MKKIKLNKKLLLAKEIISGLNPAAQQHIVGAAGTLAGCAVLTRLCPSTAEKTQCISMDTSLCVTVNKALCATNDTDCYM